MGWGVEGVVFGGLAVWLVVWPLDIGLWGGEGIF